MKSTNKSAILIFGLCLAVILSAMMGSGDLRAEDVDIYRTAVKPTAMVVMDTSGSMAWPIYDASFDYAGFMWWMTYKAYGEDDDHIRDKAQFWDADLGNSPHTADYPDTGKAYDYDRLDPNQIYLVSSVVGHDLIKFKDSENNDREVSAIGDVLYKTSNYNDSNAVPTSSKYNHRDDWLKNVIIEVYDKNGQPWTIDDGSGNPRVDTDVDGYVLYPLADKVNDICDNVSTCTGETVTLPAGYAGKTFENAQKILLTNVTSDPRTGESIDTGFLGFLKSSGFYFSGLFEKSGAGIEFTSTDSDAETYSSKERVYIFATGNWLNMIKLAEDFINKGSKGNVGEYNYGFQQDLAWINVCDLRGEADWIEGSKQIKKNTKKSHPTVHELKGTISPPAAKGIKVQFSTLDIKICDSPDDDFVELRDESDVPLFAMKGSLSDADNIQWATTQTGGSWNWNVGNPLDADKFTQAFAASEIKVYWHHIQNKCGHSSNTTVFQTDKYEHSQVVPSSGAPGAWSTGAWTCSNGDDGRGYKMKPRIEVARNALKRVVQETGNSITWGLARFNGGNGGSLLAQLGTDAHTAAGQITGLDAGGSTPLGEAMQDSYEWAYDYFKNTASADEVECASKYMLVVTDGFPSSDSQWSRITTADDGTPDFDNTSKDYVDDPNDYDNHSDDVAYWMHKKAKYLHSTHAVGFTLDNPLLGDVADGSDGLYLTAYSEGGLINAIYSISLAMADTTSFVAPVVSVDQSNRTQSGKNVYTAFFRPAQGEHWAGNLKKYGIELKTRYECNRLDAEWTLVDQDGKIATDCEGNFKPTSRSFFSVGPDGGDAAKGGVGEVMKDAMPGNDPVSVPAAGPYYDFRNIYTYDYNANGDLVAFVHNNLNNGTGILGLDVADDSERYKVVNHIYGYTYDAEANGNPKAKRAWILGDIIHSEPTVIDYMQDNATKHRFVVIGANDGMVHVFIDDVEDEANALKIGGVTYPAGSEIMAFVPPDLLTRLKDLSDTSTHHYFVDGFSAFHRAKTKDAEGYHHKTLVFGERRGGDSYWALDVTKPDPSQWKVKWTIQGTPPAVAGSIPILEITELKQTWSKPIFSRIQDAADGTFKDVVIFSGGYDPEEDGYPEAWEDDGTDPPDGVFDSATESYTDSDVTGGTYDYFNPGMNEYGRGIYVVDLADASVVFRVNYGSTTDATGADQAYPEMKWSFPADTTVVPLNFYTTSTDYGYRKLQIYAPDVYGTIWKVVYDYTGAGDANKTWQVRRIFSANPGSNQAKALDGVTTPPSTVSTDWGRKMFYPPDVSYRGTDWSDYPTLYVGTGDRPHPRYVPFNSATGVGYHDRFYVVADSEDPNKPSDDASYPVDETYLLNLTCDELENVGDVDQDGAPNDEDDDDNWRAVLRSMLFHYKDRVDADTYDCSDPDCDYPVNNQYARGWYRIMGKQGDCTQDSRDHTGEKVLSRPTLFAKVVYFTSYQPTFLDSCKPSGDALVYALDYDVGTAAFNLNDDNDDDSNPDDVKEVRDLSDTYGVVQDSTIASGVRVITRGDKAAGVFSAGGAVVGAGENNDQGSSTSIPGPPGGAAKIMWETF